MKRNKCPSTGKTKYITYSDANESMLRIKNHNSLRVGFENKVRSTGKSNQKRVYFCKYCNGFHLTSIESMQAQYKKYKEKNNEKKKYFSSIDVENWKKDSVPFESGHTPPPKKIK